MAEKDIFDEWADGVALANPPASDSQNEFFREFEMNVNKPAEFQVKPEDLPANPVEAATTPPAPIEAPVVIPEPPEVNSETRPAKKGGSITLEKTSRGWKAVLDPGESGLTPENFYAANKDELIFSICEGKLEATKAIRRLKREKLLGGDEPVVAVTAPATSKPIPTLSQLTADDVEELKLKLADNPGEGFDSYIKKRFGLDPEQFAEAVKSAPQARDILETQRLAAEIREVNEEFARENPDYSEGYALDEDNVRKLIARMAKAYLNKRITKSTPLALVDQAIAEVYKKGQWTVENLEKAKEELIDIGELHKPSESHRTSQPEPQQVTAPSSPTVPVPPRIAAPTGKPVSLGLPSGRGVPSDSATPEDKLPSAEDLQNMSMGDLKRLAQLQIRLAQQGRQ